MKANKNMIVMGVLILLLVVSAVQAVQLGNIKSNIGDISVGKSSLGVKASPSTQQSSSSGGVPTNLQNLPGMVGGC